MGKEEQEKHRRSRLGTFSTSPNDGACEGSTVDLTAGSTINLGASSTVDLEETSREQGSISVRATSEAARGDGYFLGTSRDDTINKGGNGNGNDEVPRDVMQDCHPELPTGPAAATAGVPENDPEEGEQDEGKGGGEGDGGNVVENRARPDPAAGGGGATTTGTIQSSAPNLEQVVARTNGGDRRRMSDIDAGDKGSDDGVGGQRGHRQWVRQSKGSSARPSTTIAMAPLGDGSLRKKQDLCQKQDLCDAVLGDTRQVSRFAIILFR